MRIVSLLIFFWLPVAGAVLARENPRVYAITSSVDPEAMKLLQERFDWTISFDPASRPSLDPEQLLIRLKELESGIPLPVDVLMLGSGPGKGSLPKDIEDLHTLVGQARKMKLELLWMNAPSPGGGKVGEENARIAAFNQAAESVMNEEEVSLMDFRGFSATALRPDWTVGRAQADYLQEALGQWWWVCCRRNPHLIRESLWSGQPPQYQKNPEARINKTGRVDGISQPEIVRYVSNSARSGTALIYFPGGGYGQLGFLRNVDGLGEKLSPLGITLFALKYRTGRGDDVPLLDAERAVRWVRFHARELGIDPQRIGVAGISAGANLTLNLISRFTLGKPLSDDPVEELSSRPDFAVVLTSWNHGSLKSPFSFSTTTPPVFLRHARNDSGFPLAEEIVAQLQNVRVPLNFLFLENGGHGAFDQGPDSVGKDWTNDFVPWLKEQGLYSGPTPE